MSILAKRLHQVEMKGVLSLKNTVFPYPPFSIYTWSVPPRVVITSVRDKYSMVSEGGSTKETIQFTFPQRGIYDISIDMYSAGRDTVQETYNIKVVCA